jgi:y4mF family transcriptional regulator
VSPLAPASPQIQQLTDTLRARRREFGLTQVQLAELAGVSTRFVHGLEAGKPTVQLDRVLAVATTLGLELHLRVAPPGAPTAERT